MKKECGYQEGAVKVQAVKAVVQPAKARRAKISEGHISQIRKANEAHNISIFYNFLRSTKLA